MINFFCSKQCEEEIYVFQNSFINMSENFRKKIIEDYSKEKMWRNLLTLLKNLVKRIEQKQVVSITQTKQIVSTEIVVMSTNFTSATSKKEFAVDADENADELVSKKFRIDINFELSSDDLIYYVEDNIRRLCIFNSVKMKIFRLIHDVNAHVDVHRFFNKISNTLYISRLFKKIRRYVKHCSNCQMTQTKRHRLYDELMLITSSSYSFHIIAINFVLVLFDELNALFTIIDKYSRKIVLIIDKFTYSANQWINALLNKLLITDWSLSIVIISNRDFKFLSNMWQIFFDRLNTKLFIFIVYYFQIDDISERTNQIVEIVIRFLIINYFDVNFVLILSTLQTQLNNSLNVVIDLSINEINYEFKIREVLFNITKRQITNLSAQRIEYRQETTDVFVFVNAKIKIYYDFKYIFLMFKIDDQIYLRLHHDYQFFDRFNKKISQ